MHYKNHERPFMVLQVGPSLYQAGGVAAVGKQIAHLKLGGVRIQHFSSHVEGTVPKRIIAALLTLIRVLIVAGRYDVAHVHMSAWGSCWRKCIFITLISAHRVPIIIHAHGGDFPRFWSMRPNWQRSVLRWAMLRGTRFIVLSDNWKIFYSDIVGLPTDRIQVIPNAVSISPGPSPLQSADITQFVFVGRLTVEKGAFDLIEAFKEARKRSKARIQLTLIGGATAHNKSQFMSLVAEDPDIRILGVLDPKDVIGVLKRSHVFILPSHAEALPLAILEAQAEGLPVIATRVGAIPELVSDGVHGILTEVGDVRGLENAIVKMSESPELRQKFGDAGLDRVRRENSLEVFSTALRNIYHDVGKSK